MDIKRILNKIGLDTKETEIYLSLLKRGNASPAEIHRDTQIKRPTVYIKLKSLISKSYVSSYSSTKGLRYRPLKPDYLFESKEKDIKTLEKDITKIKELNSSLFSVPNTTIYQGLEGVKYVMDHTLRSSTDILGWANVELIYSDDEILNFHSVSYHRRRIEKKIWMRSLYNYGPLGLELKREGEKMYRESYIISEKAFPLISELKIFDDKIITISTKDMVGTIIQNQNIADSYRSIFKQQFEYAKKHEKELFTDKDLKFLNS